MIVTCERCTTQFQLDDSRIPPGGVRVRCSRCRHAFEIALPSPELAVPDLAGRDLDDTIPDIPEPFDPPGEPEEPVEAPALAEEEQTDPSPVSAALPDAEPAAYAAPAAPEPEPVFGSADFEADAAEPADDLRIGFEEPDAGTGVLLGDPQGDTEADEESDWGFNEDLPRPDGSGATDLSAAAAATDVMDEFLGSDRESVGGSDSPFGDGLAEGPGEPGGFDLAGIREEASESLSLADEPDEEADAGPALEVPSVPDAPESPDAEAVGASDELGSLDDWDLFSGGDDASQTASGPAVHLPLVSSDELSPQQAEDLSRWNRWISGTGAVVGWGVVALLFVYGVTGAFLGAESEAPARTELEGDIEIVEADGVWIDNVVAGSIYVISGQLRNAGAGRAEPPALVVEVLDAEGRIVAGAAPLEAPRSRRELRERSPSRRIPGLPPGAGGALASGAVVPFEAVVGSLPAGAHSYRVVTAPPARRRAAPGSPALPPVPGTEAEAPAMVAERESAPSERAPEAPGGEAPSVAPPAAPVP